ncbi:acyltransferase [Telluribacter humicola]|uniref:acyltransferase n=1 Tax=Telluribacter humicola TaxID=1720261 RepID=UPI001E4396EA|nr:acyltransferase [Telluribacter humicola]
MRSAWIALHAFGNYLFREWIMYIPFYTIRKFFLKNTLNHLGRQCFIAMGVEIRHGKNILINDGSIINKKVLLDGRGGKVVIGSHVDIAQEVNIWTLSHDPQDDYYGDKGGGVTIEDFVWIASRATILPNVTLGRGCVVASGSVVTKDVPPMTIVAGVPAQQIGLRKSQLKYRFNHQPWFR